MLPELVDEKLRMIGAYTTSVLFHREPSQSLYYVGLWVVD